MNPSTIYSKSGKGVQEASGKTSLLKRGDRAVLSAIDGRATLAEVAQKVGKPFDAAFEQLIGQLDKDGFVREVVAGAATTGSRPVIPRPAAKPPAPAAKAPSAASGSGEDLDFTSIMPALKPGASAPPRAPAVDKAAPPRANEQESALYKARQEAEARAQAERDRIRKEAEAKARTETEAKIRAETEKRIREEAEAKLRAEADAKAKAARDAALRIAAEAKAKAEAEAKAKIDAERKAREEAERKAREEAEKARREAEELRQRLEEERKAREAEERKRKEEEERRRKEEEERRAREEAERKAREEAERKRKEEEERRRKEEEERRAREEAERKAREEAERKAREEAERKRKEEEERRRAEEEARRAKEEAERWAREQEERARAAREEEERAERARQDEERAQRARQDEERARKALEETKIRQPTLAAAPPPPPEPEPAPVPAAVAPPAARDEGPGSLDSLMADLDSFSQREEDERAAREAAERKLREEKKRKAQEETERRAREEAEHERRQAEARRRKQEEERRQQEEAERRVREEEEQRRLEAEERKRKAKELLRAAKQAQEAADPERAAASTDDIGVTEDDLDMADVRQDEAVIAKESRKQQREREREARQREREARERAQAAARHAEPVKYSKPRRPRKWGKPVALTLFLLLVAAVGVLHVMPLPMQPYEQAASEALGRPVRIASGRLSLFTGVRLNLEGVRIGDSVKIAAVQAYPEIGALFDQRKAFNRIELEGMTIAQSALGDTLVAKLKGNDFTVKRILVKQLKLDGPVPLPAFEADATLGPDGALRSALLMGPEELMVKLTPEGRNVEFDATASSFTLPLAPEVHLSSFAMKGLATPQGMKIAAWGGSVLGGALSGTANVRWGDTWYVDGVMSVRGVNAAVFGPALLSEGKAEGAGKFSMNGTEPAKLANGTRIEGSFTINKGVLGSFDLSRAIQTDGRQYSGRTQFVEMTGQGVYDRGAVALRNVIISAGALSAGASADIAQSGALSGRIVADVRTAGQTLRQTLNLGGTVREPQVRN